MWGRDEEVDNAGGVVMRCSSHGGGAKVEASCGEKNGPGQGAKTAAARLAALLEDNCMVQQQGKLDSQDTDGLMSRKRKKTRRSY